MRPHQQRLRSTTRHATASSLSLDKSLDPAKEALAVRPCVNTFETRAFLNKNGMGALMKGQVATMSDADMKALASYIAGIK